MNYISLTHHVFDFSIFVFVCNEVVDTVEFSTGVLAAILCHYTFYFNSTQQQTNTSTTFMDCKSITPSIDLINYISVISHTIPSIILMKVGGGCRCVWLKRKYVLL